MSDMLAMLSAEPAAAVASEKSAGKPAAKTAGKGDGDKSFEQLLSKEELPQDLPELPAEQVDVAAEVEIADAVTVEPDAAEGGDLAAAAPEPEPVVVFSVAHAALQASLEGSAPLQMLLEQPVLDEGAVLLTPVQDADAPLLPEVTADEAEPALVEDMRPAVPRIDSAPEQPLEVADNPVADPTPPAYARPLAAGMIAPQTGEGQTDPAPEPEIAEEITLAKVSKPEAKPTTVAAQDPLSVVTSQPDEPQTVAALTPLQTKEATSFEKLVAQAALAPSVPDEKPVASPLVRNILDRMQELEVSEGKTRILLRPQGMGALEIDILRQADGRMHLALRVENPLVLDALRNESGALSSFMGEKGFDLSNGGPDLSSYHQMPQGEEAGPEDEAEIIETETALLDGERVNILT